MASDSAVPTSAEIERQYRLVRLMLDAHSMLKDRYTALGMAAQVGLLFCSVVFCATTFASDDLYSWLGTKPTDGRYIRGAASVVSFFFSLVLLVADFKGKAALHGAALERWSRANAEFRKCQQAEGNEWPEPVRAHLSDAYWAADKESVKIRPKHFLRLKSAHLRKVEVSKLKSRHPGCPIIVLTLVFRARDSWAAIREALSGTTRHGDYTG